MGVRPIRTEVDYDAALGEIERLMDAAPGTPDSDKLEVLAIPLEAIKKASAREPFQTEPDFGAESVNYDLRELLSRSTEPA